MITDRMTGCFLMRCSSLLLCSAGKAPCNFIGYRSQSHGLGFSPPWVWLGEAQYYLGYGVAACHVTTFYPSIKHLEHEDLLSLPPGEALHVVAPTICMHDKFLWTVWLGLNHLPQDHGC